MEQSRILPLDKYLAICIKFRCNNNCIHCMLRNFKGKLKPMSLSSFKKIIDLELKDYENIIISGAEATLSSNLEGFLEYAKNSGKIKSIMIQSNGRMFSYEEYAKRIISKGINDFLISVHASNPKTHDGITRVKGSFNQTIQGLKNLNKHCNLIRTNTVITRLNYRYLPQIAKMCANLSNVREINFWNYLPMSLRDDFNLIPPLHELRHHLLEALDIIGASKKRAVVKNLPKCILGKHQVCLDNCQPKVIIDGAFTYNYRMNKEGNCKYKCKGCNGLTLAYVRKYGYEEKLLRP